MNHLFIVYSPVNGPPGYFLAIMNREAIYMDESFECILHYLVDVFLGF